MPAKALDQPMHKVTDTPPSQASQLPQGFCVVVQITASLAGLTSGCLPQATGHLEEMWELACLRKRCARRRKCQQCRRLRSLAGARQLPHLGCVAPDIAITLGIEIRATPPAPTGVLCCDSDHCQPGLPNKRAPSTSDRTPRRNVGAGLPAKALDQSKHKVTDTPPSLANQLLQGGIQGTARARGRAVRCSWLATRVFFSR